MEKKNNLNYSRIIGCDTNNGNGFRVSLFVSGCTIHCKGCHNIDAQNFNFGSKYTQETEDKIIQLLGKDYISGFSLLGGEPFDNLQNDELINLLKRIRDELPNKTIYIWSGYYYKEIIKDNRKFELLKYADMLRGGRYEHSKRNLNQYLQGSINQICYDVQKSILKGEEVEYQFE